MRDMLNINGIFDKQQSAQFNSFNIIIHLQLLRRTEKRVKLLLGHICLSLHVIIIIYQDYCLQQRRAPHLVDEPNDCIQVRAGDALEVD